MDSHVEEGVHLFMPRKSYIGLITLKCGFKRRGNIVVTSNRMQKCQRRISRLFVSVALCFKDALRDICYMRILIF